MTPEGPLALTFCKSELFEIPPGDVAKHPGLTVPDSRGFPAEKTRPLTWRQWLEKAAKSRQECPGDVQ